MAQGRGVLTPEVQEVANNLLGYELTVRELRLMPYLQYTVMNDKRINPNHINPEEREILSKWRPVNLQPSAQGSSLICADPSIGDLKASKLRLTNVSGKALAVGFKRFEAKIL